MFVNELNMTSCVSLSFKHNQLTLKERIKHWASPLFLVVADSPSVYGGRSAVMPCGIPRFTLDPSTSLPRHPSADGPVTP